MADSRHTEKRDFRKETETHRRENRRQRRERHDSPDERKPRSRSRSPYHERHSGSTHNLTRRRYSSDSPKRLQSRSELRRGHDHDKRQNNDEKFIKQEKFDRETKEKRENEERATRDQRLSQEPDHKRDIECGQDERWGNGQRRSKRDQSNQDDIESPEQDSTENPSSDKAKDEPDFGVSGKLAAETNTFQGVVIKYSEPREARVPKTKWRFYTFKGDEYIDTLYLHRQSAYLIGRDRKIVDFPIDHPSCSKQHAVLQYRLVEYVKDDGRKGRKVKPYIIDLESTNGTYINNQRLDPSRYVEIKEKDMVKFGFSTREYVLLHENSKDSDDDEVEENPD